MRKMLPVVAALAMFALGACSDDEYSQGDFINECQDNAGLTEEQCRCAWDELTGNVSASDIQDAAQADAGDVDPEVAAQLNEALASCAGG